MFSQLFWLLGGFALGLFYTNSFHEAQCPSDSTNLQHKSSQSGILKFGNPGPIHDLLEHTAYTASFNRKERIPYWVGEHLTSENIQAGVNVSRKHSKFTEDMTIPELFRVYTKDYTNSGYDRGHMAPAADAVSTQQSLDETFLLTNIAPQAGIGFNRQYWAYFENFCRDLTANFSDVYVYTGPLFLPHLSEENNSANVMVQFDSEDYVAKTAPQLKYRMEYDVIGSKMPLIAVPTHFFKIILLEQEDSTFAMGAFVLPNQAIANKTPLSQFQVNLKAIERAAGLEFFKEIDRTQFLNLCDIVHCIV
ncbi:hypothetical protein K501DRAFT_235070 [Backusella circina FSU 941]|nr:hypothetical protein K501DRAFT_235070 [Backusella circina FSU 941]